MTRVCSGNGVGTGIDGGAGGSWKLSGVVGLGGGEVFAGVAESELSLLRVKSESVSANALYATQRPFLRRGCCFRVFGARIWISYFRVVSSPERKPEMCESTVELERKM
jgi:hypothetical protein